LWKLKFIEEPLKIMDREVKRLNIVEFLSLMFGGIREDVPSSSIDFDMGFASFVLGDNPILSSMPPISSLPSLMVCGIGDRDLLNRVVVMTSLAVMIMAAPAPTSDDLIYALSFSQKQALGVLRDIELI
ncbi:hypothetical protein Tco_0924845, partial [Tanacetum coccineum]